MAKTQRTVAAVMLLTGTFVAADRGAAQDRPTSGSASDVRSEQPYCAALLHEGIARSATFAEVVDGTLTSTMTLGLTGSGQAASAADSERPAMAPQASTSVADAPRVRSTDEEMLALVREGAERSTTFRTLADAIGQSKGIVYIEFGYCAFGHLNGCLLPFLASSHGDRYLRIFVTPDKNRRSHDQLLALIAHEMRHALEVLEHPEVVDAGTLDELYRRIGMPATGQNHGYETSAARAAGGAVLAELLVKHPAP